MAVSATGFWTVALPNDCKLQLTSSSYCLLLLNAPIDLCRSSLATAMTTNPNELQLQSLHLEHQLSCVYTTKQTEMENKKFNLSRRSIYRCGCGQAIENVMFRINDLRFIKYFVTASTNSRQRQRVLVLTWFSVPENFMFKSWQWMDRTVYDGTFAWKHKHTLCGVRAASVGTKSQW